MGKPMNLEETITILMEKATESFDKAFDARHRGTTEDIEVFEENLLRATNIMQIVMWLTDYQKMKGAADV